MGIAAHMPRNQQQKEEAMPKYLFEATYTAEGAKGLVAEGGSARRAAVEKATATAGGRVEAFYFGFGDVDAFVIADLPDNVAAASLALAVAQSGRAAVKTVALMTPEDVDKAAKKVPAYRPPGG
jgi:uncharacterized protein with GYD domain